MKREIREVITREGQKFIQITTTGERWYARQVSVDGTAENKRWDYLPSSTWICQVGYPMGIEFHKWLATKGWSEAEAMKVAGGERGSKVHQAIRRIVEGGMVAIDDKFENPTTGQPEEISADEYYSVQTFEQWKHEEKPEFLDNERTVVNEKFRYAGTLDIKARLRSDNYSRVHYIDVKTGKHIWPSMKLQVSSYAHADAAAPRTVTGKLAGSVRLGILQVGYMLNKKKHFKYTTFPDHFGLFLAARKIWAYENPNTKPFQRDYPFAIGSAA